MAEPYRVSLRGRAAERDVRRDEFEQGRRPEVDVLVVVDNGATPAEESPLLAEVASLLDLAIATELDARFAVTTTGLVAEPGGGCPGGVDGGEDGRFFPVDHSRPRIVDEHPGTRETLAANLAVGACHTAPPQTLEAMIRALTPPLSTRADDPRHDEVDCGNLGFLRPEASICSSDWANQMQPGYSD